MSASETAVTPRNYSSPGNVDEPGRDSPASYSQEALWYLNRTLRDPEAYNMTGAFSISGLLDVDILERVLSEIVFRHEPLRTSFRDTEQGVVQCVGEVPSRVLTFVDLEEFENGDGGDHVQQYIRYEATRRFDLSSERMLRATLLRLNDKQHVFILAVHHIACDGRSIEVLIQEILQLYEAFSAGEPSPLGELTMSYSEYARWQRQMHELGAWDEHQAYWRNQLDSGISKLRLPNDRAPSQSDSLRGSARRRTLNGSLAASALEFCSDEGVTPFVLLLSVYQTMLARYGAADEVCVSTPVDGRIRTELESLVGLFVNTLVIRTTVDDSPTFRQLVRQSRDRVFDAYEHQMTHLDTTVNPNKRRSGPSQMVQPQAAFAYEKRRLETLQIGEGELRRIPVEPTTSKFDLFMSITGLPDRFEITLNYREELFTEGRIEQLLDHFENLLRSAIGDPDLPIGQLSMIGPEERDHLIQLARGESTKPSADSIASMIGERVASNPATVAIEAGDESITYKQWDDRANRLANYLASLDVTSHSRVAICIDRCIELPVAILATLKLGAAFVPLDPEYPTLRLENMLVDSGASVLLSRTDLSESRPDFAGRTVLLDEEAAAIEAHTNAPVQRVPSEDSVAYLMFTSGSTGRPKAIEITERSLTNYAQSMQRRVQVSQTDRVCQFASISFDAAIKEMVLCWTSGSTLVIRPNKPFDTIEQFSSFVRDQRISVLNLPASFWHEWVDQLKSRGLPLPGCLRLMMVGGEQADLARLRAWSSLAPDVAWINTYGPTEATINATTFELAGEDSLTYTSRVPIGRPLDNVATYVLDSFLNPVPVGATGELCIAGSGVAGGYLNAPELTDQQFVRSPFATEAGRILYRSGDLARWLPDGNLEVLGRVDDQIKMRGFRIEPGEVEAALRSYPDIRDALVTTQASDGAELTLVAAVVLNDNSTKIDPGLRRYLLDRLPAHMIPSRIVEVDRLPRNVNGKVNRGELLAEIADSVTFEEKTEHEPPRNETETRLCNIWASLLNQERVGISHDFFELGGNSLLALRMIARVEDEFDAHLPLASMVHHGTIEKLAALIDNDNSSVKQSLVYELQPLGTRPPIFCVPGIGGDVLQFAALAQNIDKDQPVMAIQAVGCDDGEEPLTSIKEIAQLYVRNILARQPHGPYYLAGYSFGGTVVFEVAQQLTDAGKQVAMLIMVDTASPGYGRGEFKWVYILRFLKHLPTWFMHDYVRSGWRNIILRPVRLVSAIGRRLWNLVAPQKKRLISVDADVDAGLYTPDLPEMYRKVIAAHYEALRSYQVRPYPGKVTLLRSRVSGLFGSLEHDLGWGDVAEGGADVEIVSGAHFTMLDEPHVAALAEKMARAASEAHAQHQEQLRRHSDSAEAT